MNGSTPPLADVKSDVSNKGQPPDIEKNTVIRLNTLGDNQAHSTSASSKPGSEMKDLSHHLGKTPEKLSLFHRETPEKLSLFHKAGFHTQKVERDSLLSFESSFPPEENKGSSTFSEKEISLAYNAAENMLRHIILVLKEFCTPLELRHYLKNSLQMVDYELATRQEEKREESGDKIYRIIFDFLESKILESIDKAYYGSGGDETMTLMDESKVLESPLKTWREILQTPFRDFLLSQRPCRVFYVFFRCLAFLLQVLNTKIDMTKKAKLAQSILQILDNTPVYSSLQTRRRCELNIIFQSCRRYSLKKCIPCPCEQPKRGQG
jgi:hypothetical protein